MGEEPRVKGASFIRSIEQIHRLVEQGEISKLSLEVRLSAEAYVLFESKVEPSLWYPLSASEEFSRVVLEFAGDGQPEYLRSVGRESLAYMLERDTFRGFIEGAMSQKGREGVNLVGLAGLIYSFGRWTYEGENLRQFSVTIDDAEPLNDTACETIAGFMQGLVAHCTGVAISIEHSRPTRDRVIFLAMPA